MTGDPSLHPGQSATDAALLALLGELKSVGYRFVTPTPATHARVLARPSKAVARSLEDVFGWSLKFSATLLPPNIAQRLADAGMIDREDENFRRARVRVSRLGANLFVHSAFPTEARDAVFFGPDSYRFADLIDREWPGLVKPRPRIVDIGTGSGVGAIVAGARCPDAEIHMTDINPQALRFARINAAAAGVEARPHLGADLASILGPIDLAMANPPYIIDEAGRAYRDGGGMHGGQTSLDMARLAVARLAPGGRLILYTGSAIVGGEDPLRDALTGLAAHAGCRLGYREIDPDVFGEELDRPAYQEVDRIALVAAVIDRAA